MVPLPGPSPGKLRRERGELHGASDRSARGTNGGSPARLVLAGRGFIRNLGRGARHPPNLDPSAQADITFPEPRIHSPGTAGSR